jgi:hypothetical protein
MDQRSCFGLAEHLEALSKHGDPLEVLDATVDFEYFRRWLVEGLGYGDGSRGGRPPFDPVSMFKALILQAQHNLAACSGVLSPPITPAATSGRTARTGRGATRNGWPRTC